MIVLQNVSKNDKYAKLRKLRPKSYTSDLIVFQYPSDIINHFKSLDLRYFEVCQYHKLAEIGAFVIFSSESVSQNAFFQGVCDILEPLRYHKWT